MLSITTIRDKETLNEFIKLPWFIYQNDPYWVPPLISDQRKLFDRAIHPFHKHAEVEFFLARDEKGQPTGRITAIINHNHINYHKEQVGFFGFFECINSPAVATALLDHARDFLKSHRMERMRGPASYSSNEEFGLLVEGFDSSPVIMMTYNPPYYETLLTQYGLTKIKDLYAYCVDDTIKLPDKVYRIAERLKSKEEIVVRPIDIREFTRELAIVKEVYNKAWQYNWGMVPLTDDEINYLANELKPLIDPELVFIAEVSGKPAGFSMALPDYYPVLKKLNGRLTPLGILKLLWHTKIKKIRRLRVITMGVVPEFQKRGIDVVFYIQTIRRGLAKGYRSAEMSWILEDNELMNRTLVSFGARLYKKYRIFEMPI